MSIVLRNKTLMLKLIIEIMHQIWLSHMAMRISTSAMYVLNFSGTFQNIKCSDLLSAHICFENMATVSITHKSQM